MIRLGRPAGQDKGGRIELLHDRGAVDDRGRAHIRARIDGCIEGLPPCQTLRRPIGAGLARCASGSVTAGTLPITPRRTVAVCTGTAASRKP